jgi:hypothetical protein
MARLQELAKKSTENLVVVEEQKKVEEVPLPSPPKTPQVEEIKVETAVVPEGIATVRSSTPTPVKSPPLVRNSTPVRTSSVPANPGRGKGQYVKT